MLTEQDILEIKEYLVLLLDLEKNLVLPYNENKSRETS